MCVDAGDLQIIGKARLVVRVGWVWRRGSSGKGVIVRVEGMQGSTSGCLSNRYHHRLSNRHHHRFTGILLLSANSASSQVMNKLFTL